MLNKHEALGGRVVFFTRPSSLKVALDANKMRKIVDNLEHDLKEDVDFLNIAVYVFSSTERIEFQFQGNETELLSEFREMWEGLRPFTPESVTGALDWYLYGAREIREAWTEAVEQSNVLWIDPVEAPLEELDPATQEAATAEDSPLPSGGRKESRKITSAVTN